MPQPRGQGKNPHSFLWLAGCDVGPDGRIIRGYRHFAYDGADYITLNEDDTLLVRGGRDGSDHPEQWEVEEQRERYRAYLEPSAWTGSANTWRRGRRRCCARVPGAPGRPRSHLRLGLYLQPNLRGEAWA